MMMLMMIHLRSINIGVGRNTCNHLNNTICTHRFRKMINMTGYSINMINLILIRVRICCIGKSQWYRVKILVNKCSVTHQFQLYIPMIHLKLNFYSTMSIIQIPVAVITLPKRLHFQKYQWLIPDRLIWNKGKFVGIYPNLMMVYYCQLLGMQLITDFHITTCIYTQINSRR